MLLKVIELIVWPVAKPLQAATGRVTPSQNRMCQTVNDVFMCVYLIVFHITHQQTRDNVAVTMEHSFRLSII